MLYGGSNPMVWDVCLTLKEIENEREDEHGVANDFSDNPGYPCNPGPGTIHLVRQCWGDCGSMERSSGEDSFPQIGR